ncbi:hypothetical protein PsorP6_004696 [Peronosclerospora sorghi]|uniref:Uncharacterized protein n=1 Tax=Peronosclerospora sorghi TaxID=230839 RepID=A0ACC0VM86_9STRA|nr:hypothetical protein PsorP6_004696 [Peronosclerospora sorghi]
MRKLTNKLGLHKKEGAWALRGDSMKMKQDRSATLTNSFSVADDVEDVFYGHSRSALPSSEPLYRTTEQLRGEHMIVSALQNDAETPLVASTVSSSSSQLSTTTSSNNTVSKLDNKLTSTKHGSSTAGISRVVSGDVQLKQLQSDILEVKEEVKTIRQEVMNELHVIRYDVLKELTIIQGAIAQLAAAQSIASVPSSKSSVASSKSTVSSDSLSIADLAALTEKTSTKTSATTRGRLAASRTNIFKSPPPSARASVRLTQLAPVADSALSTPLSAKQMDQMFPLIDFTSELAAHARDLTPGTRAWALTRVEEWLDSRFNVGNDTLLAVVGAGGTGKSVFCGTVAQQFRGNLLATHCCQFDRKSKSSPRNVLLSFVHQLVENLPPFKNQLARLNLKYVLEEADPVLLAAKVLVDPLNAVEEPLHASFILVDGIDQCSAGLDARNELLEFLAQIIPQLPSWVGFMVSSKPSSKLVKRLPVSSVLDFSAKNRAYVADVSSLLNDIVRSFKDDDIAEAHKLLKQKSDGNFAYLNFTKQALSHPGMTMAMEEGALPLDVLHELPETLFDIYAEIFEDKFGQGCRRLWAVAKPLLQLVVGAAAGPYSPVTEDQAKEYFKLTAEDLQMLRRSFVDLVAVRHGAYRIETSTLWTWLSDSARSDDEFYFSIDDALQALRKMRRAGVSSTSSNSSMSSSSVDSALSSRVTTSSKTQQRSRTRHDPCTKPVGILKRGKL